MTEAALTRQTDEPEIAEIKPGPPSSYPPSVQPGIPNLGRQPDGWSRIRAGDLLKPVCRPAKLEDDQQYQLVTAKRNRGGIVPREILSGCDIRTKTQFFIEVDDFLISRRQISHGACGLVPKHLAGAVVSNEYVALKPKPGLDLRFLRHLSHSVYFQQTCFHSSIGVHVEKLVFKLEDWLDWEFDIPSLAEQRRIADVLDAWDRAIATTECLIAAKRRCFNWLYSELFPRSGDRLPSGWKAAPITKVATVRFSGVDKKTEEGEEPVFLCNYMDVFHNRRITSDLPFMNATASKREIESFSLRVGDVLFTKDSETAEEIAESSVVAEALSNVLCGYHLGIARAHPKVMTGEFLALALRHPWVREEFRKAANGVTRFGLNLDVLDQIDVFFPPPDLQVVLVGALRAVESEIKLLSKGLEPLRKQKRGLMQKLLTGDWRVGSPDGCAKAPHSSVGAVS